MLWPALVALGNGFALAGNQAAALELGDANVQSTLGQPLRASIAYALAPKESIYEHCIFLRAGDTASGLPAVRNASARVSAGTIVVTGKLPVREPLLNLHLTVNCPGTANLTRQYALFIDPAFDLPSAAATASPARPAARESGATATVAAQPSTAGAPAPLRRAAPASTQAAGERAAPPARQHSSAAAPIRGQDSYRVQRGDTLSGIAARISDRDISIWQAVDRIFAANPEAFIDNNRDLLRAGSVLVLPDLGPVMSATPATRSAATSAAQEPLPGNPPAPEAVPAESTASASVAAAAATADNREPAGRSTAAPRPGDVSAGPDTPFVSPVDAAGSTAGEQRAFGPVRDVIPDTEIAGAAAVRPDRSAARVVVDREADGLGSLAWLGGAGVAIILGLLLFGRRFRERFGTTDEAFAADARPARRKSEPEALAAVPAVDVSAEQAADPAGNIPVQVQPVALDADLGSGSGFDDDGDMDVAQDFGFSTSRDLYSTLDMEESAAPGETPAGIVPARRFTDTMIVEQEVPPGDESGEYDLSMIVDATRQPIADGEETTRDLKAIQVDTEDSVALEADDSTLAVDYKILEQDYEDELTATQALNAELAKAAAEVTLLGAAGAEADADHAADAATARFVSIGDDAALAEDEDADRTAQMPLNQDSAARETRGLDDSGVNAEVTTALPAADNDDTADADDLNATTIDTKKLRAS